MKNFEQRSEFFPKDVDWQNRCCLRLFQVISFFLHKNTIAGQDKYQTAQRAGKSSRLWQKVMTVFLVGDETNHPSHPSAYNYPITAYWSN